MVVKRLYPSALVCSIRRLTRKGWTAVSIARLHKIEVRDVRAMLSPTVRTFATPPRPKSPPPESAPSAPRERVRPPLRRPDRRPTVRHWRELDDVGPDGRPLELVTPPAAELDDQVGAELPAIAGMPSRCEWIGPTSLTGGKHKLTDAQALEVRREHAAGSSEYALARKYKVARNTIHAVIKATTYPSLLPSTVTEQQGPSS
jgi:hypothetical protein